MYKLILNLVIFS